MSKHKLLSDNSCPTYGSAVYRYQSGDSDYSTEHEDDQDFETALHQTGYGKFHYWLVMVCGWANASDAVELLCVSFLLPSAECDLNLTPVKKGYLTSIVFVGMMIGGYVWGSLGDSLGRKTVLINAMVVNGVAGLISSLGQNYWFFLIMRFISGVGVGGSIPVVWSYFGEFQPSHRRGAALSVLASFWMVGNITVAALAWAIIPHDIGWSDPDKFQFNSWRIFVVVCSLPCLLVAVALLSLPESPKFLTSKGRDKEALDVLSTMYSTNTGRGKDTFPVTRLVIDRDHSYSAGRSIGWKMTLKEAGSSLMKMFAPSLFRVTITMLVINFTIQFGYYGLMMWFPELFNKLEIYYDQHPNQTVSVCEVFNKESFPTNASLTTEFVCETKIPENEVFTNSFIVSISAAPANLWTIVHMDKLGRKFFLCFSMLLSGGSAFLIYFVTNSTMNLVLICTFGAVSTMGFNSLDCLGIELFPTSLRSTALAVTLVAARIGSILGTFLFGYLVETHCAIPILLVAGLLIGGGMLGLTLPNTTKKPLE